MGKALDTYIHHRVFNYQRVPAPLLPETMKTYAARPLSEAASRAARGAFLAHSGRVGEGRALIEEALRLDPDLADAHEAAGLLALRERRLADARASFARAVDLDPDDFHNQYVKGHFLLTGGATDASALAEAEAALQKAAQLNHDFGDRLLGAGPGRDATRRPLEGTEPVARRGISLEPGNAASHLALATLLAAAERRSRLAKPECGPWPSRARTRSAEGCNALSTACGAWCPRIRRGSEKMRTLDRRSFLVATAGVGAAARASEARVRREVPVAAGRIRLGAPVSVEGDDPEVLARACRARATARPIVPRCRSTTTRGYAPPKTRSSATTW